MIDETIEGETVVIDLRTGFYFSLNETGTAIWTLVDHSGNAGQIATALATSYDLDPETADAAVRRFLAELVEHGLVRAEDSVQANSNSGAPFGVSVANQASTFVEPLVERYTDMHDLILLDPVHEINERGWPHPRADSPTAES